MDDLLSTLAHEFTRAPGPDALIMILRLVGAAILSGLIGWERETREHAAGLRTNMLIGLAAATFAIIADGIVPQFQGESIRMDPMRLISSVTSGVAFLAAGLIVFSRGEVRGLTTGASIWLSAATGLAVGVGQWLVAVVACLCGLTILSVVRRVENGMKRRHFAKRGAPRDRPEA
ncbi:MgtC/SapB family protein [Acuticoccus sp. M5D2P5]|uniref:MgtC/SapB family protein n=1 Tax=Acuticoccus kalidii TaxID=2910977 RepID=UPI001F15D81E|nr:MgtC/SapB family protein [Acuticoccus kalidii]MCF3933926.1 MgtC/SapB family protein [Acuticoccus kalidii]